jgi:spermidine/putrescine transport system permease protein
VKRSLLPYLVTAAVLLFLYLPVLVLMANSLNASRFGGRWEGLSLRWYVRLVHEREIWHAFGNTLLIAVAATTVATVLGTSAALALHRWRSRLQQVHYALIYVPLVVPEILTGISLLLFFVALGVRLGLATLFLAHVTFCISYVAMVVLARLQDFDEGLLEGARDLGATGWYAMRTVLLPLLAPGIVAGALLAFTLSIDDFVISFFVAGPGATTLPIRIYSMIKHGSPPLINALSTILVLFTFTAVYISQELIKGRRPR